MASLSLFRLLFATCFVLTALSCSSVEAGSVHKNYIQLKRHVRSLKDESSDHLSANSKLSSNEYYANDDDDTDSKFQNDDTDEDNDYEDDVEVEGTGNPKDMASISSRSGNYTLEEGQSIWLQCNVVNAGSLNIIWSKGDETLFLANIRTTNEHRYNLYQNNTMSISRFQASDIGSYMCKLSNNKANVEYHLNMATPPVIVKMLPENNDRLVVENSPVTIQCIATGLPTPRIIWSKSGNRIDNEHADLRGHSIYIKNAHRKDFGLYQCLADNGVGKPVHGSVFIKVLHSPEIHIKKTTVNADEGYDAQLSCNVRSNPRAVISWRKNNEVLYENEKYHINEDSEGSHSILKIKNLSTDDFDKYTCNASNLYGTHSGHIRLVKQPSRATWVIGSQDPKSSNPVLQWTIESVQPLTEAELHYFKLDETKPNNQENDGIWVIVRPAIDDPVGNKYTIKHALEGLTPGKYAARLRARNTHGWSELSEQHFFDGDYETNEIRAEERLEEAPIAEISEGRNGADRKSAVTMSFVISSIFTLCLAVVL